MMENLNRFGLVELSREEMQEVNGGFWLQALVFVASAILGYIFAERL
ncbi:class IIb bacteriocin, lactobin A/cerein 7B family [Dyadobacter diqingensis]|nr:class IIb bacteriocin, lactobin A/cerein 7B family [Dyadobacter diqingensis]